MERKFELQNFKIPFVRSVHKRIDPLRIVNCAPLIKSKIVYIFKNISARIGGKNVWKIFARMIVRFDEGEEGRGGGGWDEIKKKAGGFLEKNAT